MKSSTVTFTQLIKSLQDLNQDLRLRLSSMPSYTEQEMKSLELFLEAVEKLVVDLENHSSIIYHHLQILKTKYQEQLQEATSKG